MKGKLYIKQYLVLVTTLLLVLLQPLHALQHIYVDAVSHNFAHTDANHEHHDHDHNQADKNVKCSICEFTFQPYLVAETVFIPHFYAVINAAPSRILNATYFFQSYFHNYLRGPPALFLV